RVGRRSTLVSAGEVLEIEPGVVHGFSNPGHDPVRMRVDVRPALDMEEMLCEVVALAEAGRLTRRGMPRDLLDLARLARTYDEVAHAPFLSLRLQRALLAPILLVARLRRAKPAAAPAPLSCGRAPRSLCRTGTRCDARPRTPAPHRRSSARRPAALPAAPCRSG